MLQSFGIFQEVFLIVLVAESVAQRPVYSNTKHLHDGRTVLLGGLFPLSENVNGECGLLRPSAVAAMEAMVYAIRQINSNSTLLPGIRLTYDIRDTCSIPNKALEQSLGYVRNSSKTFDDICISGIIGAGSFSHVSQVIAGLFRLFKIPQISYGSTATALSNRVQYDYFFRTVPPDSHFAKAMADVVIHFQWTYIIALYSDDNYGSRGLEVIVEKIQGKMNTTCIAARIPIPIGNDDPELFDDIVKEMNQPWVQNATVALMFGYRRQTAGLMEAIERLLEKEPDNPLKYLTWVGCAALTVDSKYYYLMHGRIQLHYKVKGSDGFQNYFNLLTDSNATDSNLFREYWEHVNNCSFTHETCNYNSRLPYSQEPEISSIIDAVHSYAHAIHGLIQAHCSGDSLCPNILSRSSTGVSVDGTMIRDFLLQNLTFPGLSSDIVTFDDSGNDRSSFSVFNFIKKQESYEQAKVGTWIPGVELELTDEVEWNGNKSRTESFCSKPCKSGYERDHVPDQSECCWTCKECMEEISYSDGVRCSTCPPGYSPNTNRSGCVLNKVTYLTWSHPLALIVLSCACMGLAVTMGIIAVFALFNQHAIIKASSRELSAILLAGLLLCYALPFLFVVKPSPAWCAVRRFAPGFGFAVCFSALLIKTNRLHRIFNRSPGQLMVAPKFIGPVSQVVITLLLLSVQVVIISVWLVLEKPDVAYIPKSTSTELMCKQTSSIGLMVSLGYNFLLLILSTYFAFLVRKIPDNFNEAKYINVTLYTITIILLVFIPAYFIMASISSVYQTGSLVLATLLNTTTTLGCLFVPRVCQLLQQIIKGKKRWGKFFHARSVVTESQSVKRPSTSSASVSS